MGHIANAFLANIFQMEGKCASDLLINIMNDLNLLQDCCDVLALSQ